MKGMSTKQIAQTLGLAGARSRITSSRYSRRPGVQSRGELVGQFFLEHYVPRWVDLEEAPAGRFGKVSAAQDSNGSRAQVDYAADLTSQW